MSSSSDAERSRVRRRWLVQISGHAGKNERGKWGGGVARGVKDVAGNSPWPSGAGGGTVVWTGESGGARATRRCVTDRWGRAATGPDGQRWGVGGRGVSEAAWWRVPDRWAPLIQCRATRFKLGFKPIQNIQTVQMKFEILQTLVGSKDIFPCSKNLK
jgi:hypothetical protein